MYRYDEQSSYMNSEDDSFSQRNTGDIDNSFVSQEGEKKDLNLSRPEWLMYNPNNDSR